MRLAFVVPRYGIRITGGAETLCRDYATRLAAAGHDVRVLTTCAVDHFTWKNLLPTGMRVEEGVAVERFPVTEPKDDVVMQRLEAQLAAGRPLAARDEVAWVRNTGYSQGMIDRAGELADHVDALLFMPYLFASTGFGAAVRPDRTIIVPCLHDESYARFGLLQDVLRNARGLIFNSHAEATLAGRLLGASLPAHRVVGGGVQPGASGDAPRFRARTGVQGDLVCYAGRREPGKNWPLLLEWMTLYDRALSRTGPATLATMGQGGVVEHRASRGVMRDLGYLDQQTKLDAMAASVVVAQLSVNESFSYVLFESWMAGTPVLVHARGAVTREHCEHSGGGLWVRNPEQFAAALDRLRSDAVLRAALAEQGRRYALEQHAWPQVITRLEQAITELAGTGSQA